MKECVIGVDAGTGSVKGLLVDASGTIVATASAPIRLSAPRPGWAEQNPEDWWKATIQVLDTLTVDRNLKILAVSISGQMHSLVPLDEAGDVVRPAILWCDQRTQQECVELTAACGGEQEVIKALRQSDAHRIHGAKAVVAAHQRTRQLRPHSAVLPAQGLPRPQVDRPAHHRSFRCFGNVALPRARGYVG